MNTYPALAFDRPKSSSNSLTESGISHSNLHYRDKMLLLSLLRRGVTCQTAADIIGVRRGTVLRYLVAFRRRSSVGLQRWYFNRAVSEIAAYRELIPASVEFEPAETVTNANDVNTETMCEL
jgi:hypothetical protein